MSAIIKKGDIFKFMQSYTQFRYSEIDHAKENNQKSNLHNNFKSIIVFNFKRAGWSLTHIKYLERRALNRKIGKHEKYSNQYLRTLFNQGLVVRFGFLCHE